MKKRYTAILIWIIVLLLAIGIITANIFGFGIESKAKAYAGEAKTFVLGVKNSILEIFEKDKVENVQDSGTALNYSEIEELFALKGFSKAEANITGENLLLKKGCTALVMPVADTQLLSIYYGLMNESYARPLTHDLIKSMIDMFEIKVRIIKIAGMADGVYTANIILEQENKLLNLDARPSDAAGIAVRTNADIYVKDEIMEKYGEKVC
ncbi:bifunctional nuclease family protein [archaeon]|nr:bifunctional nuclease family protein [archaeon]